MIKVIKMTTFTKFIELSKQIVKKSLCDLYDLEYSETSNDFKVLMSALNWIRKSRNACAHNERIIFLTDNNPAIVTRYHKLLTNAYRQRARSKQMIDLLIFLKYFNTQKDYESLIRSIQNELNQISKVVDPIVFEKIRVSLGLRQIEHMIILSSEPKQLDYARLIMLTPVS
jgi:abortive infection bacteriophage resistance protein